jgi:signal peptidase I
VGRRPAEEPHRRGLLRLLAAEQDRVQIAARIAGIAAAALVVAVVVFAVAFVRLFREPSSSMEPTLHCAKPGPGCLGGADDKFAVLKIGGWGRGDVVVFDTPPAAVQRCQAAGKFVKRVIGLPGDTVRERKGIVSVDGRQLSEPYVPAGHRSGESGTWQVPAGSYFLLGDNRAESCDSRAFGAVPKRDIVGRVFLVYWPPSRLGFR